MIKTVIGPTSINVIGVAVNVAQEYLSFKMSPLDGKDGRLSTRSISVKVLLKDISKGLSDAELMHRHELTHVQLQRIFAQLLEAGHIGDEVLEERKQQEAKTSKRVSQSLPLSREKASHLRRYGLVLILASYMFEITMYLGDKLGRIEVDVGLVPLFCGIGWIVSAIWGCLWRVRGLGQNSAWAIVAPVVGLNLVVVEALPNRYEPRSDPRVLRMASAVGVVVAFGITAAVINRLL